DFPLADWVSELVGLPAALGNDADVAGLAEALHGAGKGLSPIFYITIGSGIGGGFIIDREIYRGVGKGAAEIGHLLLQRGGRVDTLESFASGWGIQEQARRAMTDGAPMPTTLWSLCGGDPAQLTAPWIAYAAEQGDAFAL